MPNSSKEKEPKEKVKDKPKPQPPHPELPPPHYPSVDCRCVQCKSRQVVVTSGCSCWRCEASGSGLYDASQGCTSCGRRWCHSSLHKMTFTKHDLYEMYYK